MSSNKPKLTPGGGLLQAGIPKRAPDPHMGVPVGLMLRAVVLATYVTDDAKHPMTDMAGEGQPNQAVYCDVLVYSQRQSMRVYPLQNVLVLQPKGGIHKGNVWKPRATKVDVSGNTVDQRKATKPTDMDGDHVIIGFLENNFKMPVIVGSLPHPQADVGASEGDDKPQKLRLKLVDGDPDLTRHHGVVWGVTDDGDFLVDTREANDGSVDKSGKEPEPPTDGSHGNYNVKMPKGAIMHIQIEEGETITIEEKDGKAKLTLGDGAVKVAIADHLKDLYASLKSYIQNAMVPTGMGPSGTIVAGSGPAPSWSESIESTHLIIPDENPG